MLAGPRKKQKISADPRNKQWVDDSNKFGVRLMQKMGWSHGKGLGANMDGETQNVRVVMKADSKGLGFSNKEEDNWIAHQDDFNDILSQLHQEHSNGAEEATAVTTVTPKSIEERSKKSKRRVHYKKFTQGKDLAKRSVDDMNCILGKRSGSSTPHSISAPTSDTEDDHAVKLSHGVRTSVNSITLQDYFAQKMSQKKKNLKVMNGDGPEGNSPPPGDSPDDCDSQEGNAPLDGDSDAGCTADDRRGFDEEIAESNRGARGDETGDVDGSSGDQQIVGSGEVVVVKKKKKKRKQRDMQQGTNKGDCLYPLDGQMGSRTREESEIGAKPKSEEDLDDDGDTGPGEGVDALMSNGATALIEEESGILKKKRKKSKKERTQDC